VADDAQPEPDVESDPDVRPDPEPDQAWKALSLVNDWIRHAETKTAGTLAATGVAAGVLYNLVRGWDGISAVGAFFAFVCGIALVGSAVFCAITFAPRLRVRKRRGEPEDLSNRLFFKHIALSFKGDAPSYAQVLATLTSDPHELTRQIAHQVHANAGVAHAKFRWVDLALCLLFIALAALAVVALFRVFEG
jgi:hypothetical protein